MGEAKSQILTLGDVRLHAREWGDPQRPLLLLVHGLASTSHMFDLIAPTLAEHFHVVAPDQRGHGLSDKPATGYDFETISGDLDRLLDAYGADQAMIVGHSWGAYTLVYYAATRPQRVTKGALLDGGVRVFRDLYPTWDEAEIALAPPTYESRTVADIERMIEFDWLGSAFRPELLPLALSVFDTSDPQNVHAHLRRASHMEIAHTIWAMRPADYYSQIECPLLIINATGESPNGLMVEDTRAAEQTIAQAQIVWMLNTVHDIPWQRPRELLAVLTPFLLG
jgi:pimeloyl-ACP methyl ester carboxylesterase